MVQYPYDCNRVGNRKPSRNSHAPVTSKLIVMPKDSCIITAIAAFGAGSLATLCLKRAYAKKQDKFKIPIDLLSGKYSAEMQLAVRLALEGE